MKLTGEEIDKILDDAADYIYDDLWNEFDAGWVEDYLSDNEIVAFIFESLLYLTFSNTSPCIEYTLIF